MRPADILVAFAAAMLFLGMLNALVDSVVGDFVAGFFESVAALFTRRGREDLRRYGFMGWKRR